MGMFNYVDFEMDCPKCGKPMGQFQTKDYVRDDLNLSTVSPLSVSKFYNRCKHCNHRILFVRQLAKSLDEYVMVKDEPSNANA